MAKICINTLSSLMKSQFKSIWKPKHLDFTKIEAIYDNETVDQVFIRSNICASNFLPEMVTRFKTAMTIM